MKNLMKYILTSLPQRQELDGTCCQVIMSTCVWCKKWPKSFGISSHMHLKHQEMISRMDFKSSGAKNSSSLSLFLLFFLVERLSCCPREGPSAFETDKLFPSWMTVRSYRVGISSPALYSIDNSQYFPFMFRLFTGALTSLK